MPTPKGEATIGKHWNSPTIFSIFSSFNHTEFYSSFLYPNTISVYHYDPFNSLHSEQTANKTEYFFR